MTPKEVKEARTLLELEHGKIWDTNELQKDFNVESFLAPYVVVVRKHDGVKGSLLFQHSPRFYWGFERAIKLTPGTD